MHVELKWCGTYLNGGDGAHMVNFRAETFRPLYKKEHANLHLR